MVGRINVPTWLEKIVEKEKPPMLVLLHMIQEKEGFISKECMLYISEHYGVPVSRVYSVVTFFSAFKTEKRGKHVIRVCSGTACNVKKNIINLNYLEKELGIKPGETTPDNLFTLEKVNCLGTCSLAPVVEIDGQIYSVPKVEMLAKIIQRIKKEELV